ncbi:head maturation protease, ClpP-related [Thioclava sp. 'Guangxiensis']|uniref:head maturation protease, ClpP-related n=1 Tax=Thioclava sp. 'Guangxiensis' TaxID=3149044 RepID=UPI003877A741
MMKASDLIVGGELILSGTVLLDDYAGYMLESDIFFAPRMVREALQIMGEGPVTVRLNSGGGHVWAGEQIRAILAAHPGGATIVVEGLAASAASLLLMAGTKRVMSQGSQLMIHDPSGFVFGTEAEMRREADVIGASANTYAAVYASASGKTSDEVREIMKAETWYGPEEAVAQGFADGIAGEDSTAATSSLTRFATMEAARAAFMSAGASFEQLLSRVPQMPNVKEATMTTPNTQTQAPPAPQAPLMSTPPQTPLAPAPQPAPRMATPQPDPVAAERARVKGIREMAAPFLSSGRLMQADIDALIDDGTALVDAGTRFMAQMASAEAPSRSHSPARITRDETDTRMEGMIGALMKKTDGPAAEYRGLRIKRMAMDLGGATRGYDEAAQVKRGMMATTMTGGALGVSDFAYITTEVMKRTLLAAYQRRAASWQLVTGAPISAADFRELHAVRFGGDFQLKPVGENGEYKQARLVDEAEGLKVERRGRTINLTFESVINDDMGAFQRIPTEFATAARLMESSMVWTLFRNNAKLKSDGKALFHADHGNLAGTAAAISVASIAAARKAMWEQRAFGSKDSDDFLSIEADRLIVPPALEMVAGQFITTITPAKTADVNPFSNSLTPSTVGHLGAAAGGSDTAWYLVSSDMPPIQHAYLEGYEAPTVETLDGMNPDVVTMNARHIFGAAAVEYRGTYKNAGA